MGWQVQEVSSNIEEDYWYYKVYTPTPKTKAQQATIQQEEIDQQVVAGIQSELEETDN